MTPVQARHAPWEACVGVHPSVCHDPVTAPAVPQFPQLGQMLSSLTSVLQSVWTPPSSRGKKACGGSSQHVRLTHKPRPSWVIWGSGRNPSGRQLPPP